MFYIGAINQALKTEFLNLTLYKYHYFFIIAEQY